ncbi:hypothetical protein BDK51DRAFT_31977 [Blyttiomyces helicus]|uniref:Uncharacterized protein n=1 Tax=Blyttiomyces helicus TaxID=388810 RepID=A0A4P9WCP4_9FUNG|nr:hypothetical protein BDK51DRAFT_31977 [Blyttiomyces helicus]|eukprot:RKO90431.1 hypothetical protein BDK51DRAFT_31977 [Blyttiomyces helicus]
MTTPPDPAPPLTRPSPRSANELIDSNPRSKEYMLGWRGTSDGRVRAASRKISKGQFSNAMGSNVKRRYLGRVGVAGGETGKGYMTTLARGGMQVVGPVARNRASTLTIALVLIFFPVGPAVPACEREHLHLPNSMNQAWAMKSAKRLSLSLEFPPVYSREGGYFSSRSALLRRSEGELVPPTFIRFTWTQYPPSPSAVPRPLQLERDAQIAAGFSRLSRTLRRGRSMPDV